MRHYLHYIIISTLSHDHRMTYVRNIVNNTTNKQQQ